MEFIKKDFKKGQVLKVIKNNRSLPLGYDNHLPGDVIAVSEPGRNSNNDCFYCKCHGYFIWSIYYDLVEYKEKDVCPFEIGEKVRVKKVYPLASRYKIGDIATYLRGNEFRMYTGVIQQGSGDYGENTFESIPKVKEDFDILSDAYPFLGGWVSLTKKPRKEKKIMRKLITLAKKLLDPETKSLMEIGWLDSELDLTEDGERAILVWLLEQNKSAIAKEAKDLLAEEKKAKKDC